MMLLCLIKVSNLWLDLSLLYIIPSLVLHRRQQTSSLMNDSSLSRLEEFPHRSPFLHTCGSLSFSSPAPAFRLLELICDATSVRPCISPYFFLRFGAWLPGQRQAASPLLAADVLLLRGDEQVAAGEQVDCLD